MVGHCDRSRRRLLMAAGGVIALVNPAMLVSPQDQINGAVHIYAGYLASRNLCIAALLLVLMVMRKTRALGPLVLTALIQLADATSTPWRAAGPSFLAFWSLAYCSFSRRRGSVATLLEG